MHSTAAQIILSFFSLTLNNLPASKIIVDLIFFPPDITRISLEKQEEIFFASLKNSL